MHRHVGEWYKQLQKRGFKEGGLVHRIDNKAWTKEDVASFKTDWTAVPCKALEVRITDSALPYGAKGPAVRTRRTMLPWFVGLQADLEHLEITEGGSFEDLSKAHRDLVSGPYTPSGLANRYGDIPYAFPAAIALTGLGPLSDAAVGRVKYDMPAVVAVKNMLWTGTDKEQHKYIEDWRKKAVVQVVEAFALMKETEMKVFGEKSYFALKQMNALGSVEADVDPAPEDESFDHGGHGIEDDTDKAIAAEHSEESGSSELSDVPEGFDEGEGDVMMKED